MSFWTYFDALGDGLGDVGREGAHFYYGPAAEDPGVVIVPAEFADDEKGFAQEVLALCIQEKQLYGC